jgi:hypothetical protein
MTDLSKLTAKDFSDAMHKGWKGKEWCEGVFFKDTDGEALWPWENKKAAQCCAIGAMALTLKADGFAVRAALDDALATRVALASNAAGNKRAAMKAVDAILLGEAQS